MPGHKGCTQGHTQLVPGDSLTLADADYVNTSSMYTGIKQASSPTATNSITLKTKSGENITDQKKQWVEHFLKLYSTQNVMTDAALDAICQLSRTGRGAHRGTTASRKFPGEDGIPGEVIKARKAELIEDLHELHNLCWKEGSVQYHREMRGTNIDDSVQWQPQQLQKLSGHLPVEHLWQIVC